MARRVLILLAVALTAATTAGAESIPLVVTEGRCDFTLPTEHPNRQYYVVIGSLASARDSVLVHLHNEAASVPEPLPRERVAPIAAWRETQRQIDEQQEKTRRRPAPALATPASTPLSTRTFHVFIKERDLDNPAHYAAVQADLRAVGRRCQVYLDRAEPRSDEIDATIADVVRAFDDEIQPWAERHLGQVRDVDRDGRFTILLSPLLAKLQSGKVAIDGFVRGSDFQLDVAAPFGNRCDMMYLNSRVRAGAYLRTLLAHEYTHAVLFCEHVLERHLAGAPMLDEEGWLNEGLAHVVESLQGHSWGNLDYRLSAYQANPERYPLVVEDYFHAGLWRTPGTRGAAFLFTRACHDRHADLLPKITQSSLHGTANLEAATQEPFADLFRAWSVAALTAPPPPGCGRLCVGPRCHEMALAGAPREFKVAGSAVLYLHLHSAIASHTRVSLHTDPAERLQVTLVTVPDARPGLQLTCEPADDANHVRLRLTAQHGHLRLDAACWEKALPTGQPGDTSFDPAAPARESAAWFGDADLAAGEERISPPIAVSADVVFKVSGHTAAGERLAGWAGRDDAKSRR